LFSRHHSSGDLTSFAWSPPFPLHELLPSFQACCAAPPQETTVFLSPRAVFFAQIFFFLIVEFALAERIFLRRDRPPFLRPTLSLRLLPPPLLCPYPEFYRRASSPRRFFPPLLPNPYLPFFFFSISPPPAFGLFVSCGKVFFEPGRLFSFLRMFLPPCSIFIGSPPVRGTFRRTFFSSPASLSFFFCPAISPPI